MLSGKKQFKIGILTTFDWIDEAYSLCNVVLSQLRSLAKHGYETVLFVHDNFRDDAKIPEGIEIRKVVPRFFLRDWALSEKTDDKFEDEVKKTVDIFNKELADIDFCIEHDMIFQAWFLQYNVAIRRINTKTKWLHWIHSAPSPRPHGLSYPHEYRFTKPDNSLLVYLNNYDCLRLAEMYSTWMNYVRVVPNPMDAISFLGFDNFTARLIDKYRLFDTDILSIYPLSTPRMVDGKQVDKAIKIISKMNKLGANAKIVICNAHANALKEKQLIQEVMRKANLWGLTSNEVIFTSLEGKDYELGVPHRIVKDLFQISNVFIFPTKSENCSLILLEAALSKNLLVLNDSFPPIRDIVQERALYFPFGSVNQMVNYDDEEQWYEDVSKIILSELRQNRALNSFNKIKQNFNEDHIFINYLEPLFYDPIWKETKNG